jgi:predicted secreted protein
MKWLKRWRGRHLYCAAFGLLLVGCAAIRTNSAATSQQLASITGTLTLTAPETANVGAAVPVTIGPIAAPAGTTVALTAVFLPNIAGE